jgi:hypothetical protein
MSLKPEPLPPVPEETARVARATFPRGNVVMHMRDALGTIYTDELSPICFRCAASQRRPRGVWRW